MATPRVALFVAMAAASATLIACQASSWGPLAVSNEDAEVELAARGGAGPLRIDDACVTLLVEEVDRQITLVWRSGQTSWDAESNQVVFEDGRAGEMRLADGDRIEVGGAGITAPGDADQGAPQPIWLAAPDSSCPHELFAVHSVRRLVP